VGETTNKIDLSKTGRYLQWLLTAKEFPSNGVTTLGFSSQCVPTITHPKGLPFLALSTSLFGEVNTMVQLRMQNYLYSLIACSKLSKEVVSYTNTKPSAHVLA
jgi:hypothetical protein